MSTPPIVYANFHRSPRTFDYELMLGFNHEGKTFVVIPGAPEELASDGMIPERARIFVDHQAAQSQFDALVSCGFRPSKSPSDGVELESARKHNSTLLRICEKLADALAK